MKGKTSKKQIISSIVEMLAYVDSLSKDQIDLEGKKTSDKYEIEIRGNGKNRDMYLGFFDLLGIEYKIYVLCTDQTGVSFHATKISEDEWLHIHYEKNFLRLQAESSELGWIEYNVPYSYDGTFDKKYVTKVALWTKDDIEKIELYFKRFNRMIKLQNNFLVDNNYSIGITNIFVNLKFDTL